MHLHTDLFDTLSYYDDIPQDSLEVFLKKEKRKKKLLQNSKCTGKKTFKYAFKSLE